MFAAAMRPGVLLGAYPQRTEAKLDRLAQLAAKAGGAWRQHVGRVRRAPLRQIKRIHRYGAELEGLSAVELASRVAALRKRLGAEGFRDDLVAEGFALVRAVSTQVLGMTHYDVQLAAGWALLDGCVTEMQTGEGKTLTASLPAAVAALAGVPVHVVTVNDYLVERDAETMRPLYEALGLRVGTVTEGMSHDARRRAYACDITYCTNKQLAFDYLRDGLLRGAHGSELRAALRRFSKAPGAEEPLLLRGLCYAIVDEADSVFIDEARTPLILSKAADTSAEERVYRQALDLARGLARNADYTVDTDHREIELTDEGLERLEQRATGLGGAWKGARRREELVTQALTALHFFVRDVHYLVRDERVVIIDEYTGRVMPDRSWEQGLHQLIEAKEDCPITAPPDTLARISYQRFFRRYLHLAGMTGTAREVRGELWSIYGLELVEIPTHKPPRRRRLRTHLFATVEEKWRYVVERVRALEADGRAVLIGTRSVEASEQLSERLAAAGVAHQVLNARQDSEEASIVARAGQRGTVTVATNMAGRGTDITLDDTVREAGGLHVIATERHHAGRIDRQLFGRCARQGDPGSVELVASSEDEVLTDYYLERAGRALTPRTAGTQRTGRWADLLSRVPQRAAERAHARVRRQLLRADEQLGRTLAFSGRGE